MVASFCSRPLTRIGDGIPTAVQSAVLSIAGINARCELVRDQLETDSLLEMSSVVGLTGKVRGSVCVSLPRDVVLQIVNSQFELDETSSKRVAIDCVNELANVIAGQCKQILSEDGIGIGIGLPNFVTGTAVYIKFPQNSSPLRFEFGTDFGRVLVVVGLIEC